MFANSILVLFVAAAAAAISKLFIKKVQWMIFRFLPETMSHLNGT